MDIADVIVTPLIVVGLAGGLVVSSDHFHLSPPFNYLAAVPIGIGIAVTLWGLVSVVYLSSKRLIGWARSWFG